MPLLTNEDPCNKHNHETYIKDELPYGGDPQNDGTDFSFMCFRLFFVHRMPFVFIIYHQMMVL